MSTNQEEARMLTKSTRRALGTALTAGLAVMVFSEWAVAQQMGLFPLAPIRRQRVPCSHEDPVYRLYREQYFGYHPTMWRRFPDGWGAPSPEAPDAARSYAEIPLQPPEDLDMDYDPGDEFGGPDPGMGGQPGGPGLDLPAPPEEGEHSPFELDRPNGPGGAAPNREAPQVAPPPGAPEEGDPSPFEQFNPRAGAPRGDDLELAPPSAARSSRSWNSRRFDSQVAEAGRPILSMDAPAIRVDDRGSGLEDMTGALDAGPVNPRYVADQPETGRQDSPRKGRVATLIDAPRWTPTRR